MKALFFLFLMATSAVYADTVFLNPETCVTDSASGTQYCGQWMQLGYNIQLNYSANCLKLQEPARGYCLQANPPFTEWINDTLGIVIHAPPFPTIDDNLTLWANSSISNYSSWDLNLTCLANASQINYTIYQNQTVYVNQTLALNQELFYDYNQTYRNETSNLTIHCPPFPNLGFLNKQYAWGEQYQDTSRGINISCGTPGTNQALFFGETTPNGMYCVNYTKTVNCTKQYTIQTENGTKTLCFDKLEDLCNPSEVMGFDIRRCYERNIVGLKGLSDSLNEQLTTCSFQKNACVNGTMMAENQRLTNEGTLESGSILILVFVVVAAGIYFYFKRKKKMSLEPEPRLIES